MGKDSKYELIDFRTKNHMRCAGSFYMNKSDLGLIVRFDKFLKLLSIILISLYKI